MPLTGKGTFDDPRRPLYAPGNLHTIDTKAGIIGMSYVLSDDGTLALAEFVARNRSAFAPMLAATIPASKYSSRA